STARPSGTARRPRRQRVPRNRVPDDILNDPELQRAIAKLPSNYNFEVGKTVWRIRESAARRVALQFPEGLLMYACVIVDILERFGPCDECVVMGDVTYGACCVEDLTAAALGCDLLVHYGHSCLVPLAATAVRCLYVFVDIAIDVDHLVACVEKTLASDRKLAVMGTIQFGPAVHAAREALAARFAAADVPQAKPLSPGEVLGCTSPVVGANCDAMVFVADGRFHLEAAMIRNPSVEAYRYDPYSKVMTREYYETAKMLALRRAAVDRACGAAVVGVILGTLGRQGNPGIVRHVCSLLRARGRQSFVLLLSEIFPAKLALFSGKVDAWVQVACPRLSIDWGHLFDAPVLSAYEAEGNGGEKLGRDHYPMDYYANGSGPWTNQFEKRTAT
ncbi:unnamed protein product, partial [Phaeothamnion confervicola]